MKILDCDWQTLERPLRVWSGLASSSRRILKEALPGAPMHLAPFGADAAALISSGLLKPHKDGLRAAPSEQEWPFFALARLLQRAPILADPSLVQLTAYLSEVFNADERGGLGRRFRPTWTRDEGVAQGLSLESHVRSFVEAKDLRVWEEHFREDPYHASRRDRPRGQTRFHQPAEADAARRLVALLIARPAPIPLLDLFPPASEQPPELVTAAALGLVRYAVAFVAERPSDGEIVLTLWPAISARLHRVHAASPAQVQPTGERTTDFGIEDIETLLLETSREPLRIRAQDGQLFEKRRKEVEAALRPQGRGVDQVHARMSDRGEWRLIVALEFARLFRWLRITEEAGKPAHSLTADGRTWLGLAHDERRVQIYDALRGTAERRPLPAAPKPGARRGPAPVRARANGQQRYFLDDPDTDEFDGEDFDDEDSAFDEIGPLSGDLTFLPPFYGIERNLHSSEIAGHVVAAFEDLPVGEFFDVEAFLRHRSEARNPLPAALARSRERTYAIEELEDSWRARLFLFLHVRLVPLGAAVAGEHGRDGRLAFALTPRAAYLFGATDVWPAAEASGESARVLIQPNFEIVFPLPAPGIESRLVAFAERLPERFGTKLRLTRASVSAAANAGLGADSMLQTLRDVSLNPIPRNVEHELREWAASTATLVIEEVSIVRCSDSDMALRLLTAAGSDARLLGESIVELPTGGKLTALVRKLRAKGLFLASRPRARKR